MIAPGTGAFMFKERKAAEKSVLVRNPNYWDPEIPYLDGVEMLHVPAWTDRGTAVLTGQADYSPNVSLETHQEGSSARTSWDGAVSGRVQLLPGPHQQRAQALRRSARAARDQPGGQPAESDQGVRHPGADHAHALDDPRQRVRHAPEGARDASRLPRGQDRGPRGGEEADGRRRPGRSASRTSISYRPRSRPTPRSSPPRSRTS